MSEGMGIVQIATRQVMATKKLSKLQMISVSMSEPCISCI